MLLLSVALAIPYQNPPDPIPRILDSDPSPAVLFSPDYQWWIELKRPPLLPIARLSTPELALAGAEVDPLTWGPPHEQGYTGLDIHRFGPLPQPTRSVTLPDAVEPTSFLWSPNGTLLSIVALEPEQGYSLWLLNPADGGVQRLTAPVLQMNTGAPCRWLSETEGLLCLFRADEAPPPSAPAVPDGPRVEENLGRKAPARTTANLLKNAHDEALFHYYFRSSIERVGLSGQRQRVLAPDLYSNLEISPDGGYFRVDRYHEPFSYQVDGSRFPTEVAVYAEGGNKVWSVDLPLADNIPIAQGSVRTGPRRVSWRPDAPATLVWIEALDEGNAQKEATYRDAAYLLAAPFTAPPTLLFQAGYRISGIQWGRDDLALLEESWPKTRQLRTWRINPAAPTTAPTLIFERSSQDAYNHPGSPLQTRNAWGRAVLRMVGNTIYLAGEGASPGGLYPFLDRYNLDTRAKTRIFTSADPYLERVVDMVDARTIITRRQSQTDPPNYFLRRGNATPRALTNFPDPAPEFAGITRQLITYTRADGLELSANLYLPAGYDPTDGPLPTLFWCYPFEYKRREDAAQVTSSPNQFTRPSSSSHLYFLLRGWAIVDNPRLPIIGEGEVEPNDTYVEQLVQSAEAAVAAVVDRKIADPQRLVVGGHSYGAFTTANLLAHTDLFRAGIARSGAFNRTLTPFGFQGEDRSFWEADETYIRMSPFANADQINEPLLLIHGGDDSNDGTWPMQSERLYQAIRGLGGTARWVELPYEDHGYAARESVGHVLWEMLQWGERYTTPPS